MLKLRWLVPVGEAMTDERNQREDILERLTRLEGAVASLLLQLEAGDNSIRQLLRFDQDRFERIDRELDDIRSTLNAQSENVVPRRDIEKIAPRITDIETAVRHIETTLATGKGRGETWKSILVVVVPATLAFMSSLIVAWVAWQLTGFSSGAAPGVIIPPLYFL